MVIWLKLQHGGLKCNYGRNMTTQNNLLRSVSSTSISQLKMCPATTCSWPIHFYSPNTELIEERRTREAFSPALSGTSDASCTNLSAVDVLLKTVGYAKSHVDWCRAVCFMGVKLPAFPCVCEVVLTKCGTATCREQRVRRLKMKTSISTATEKARNRWLKRVKLVVQLSSDRLPLPANIVVFGCVIFIEGLTCDTSTEPECWHCAETVN